MNNTVKQFAVLISNFIDKTFIPLIEAKTMENLKAIDQWNGLKTLLMESQSIQLWKIENYIAEVNPPETKQEFRHQLYESKEKGHSTSGNRTYSVYPEKQSWNMHRQDQLPIGQIESIVRYKSPGISSKLSPTVEKQQEKASQSFQNLLASFRKLCNNFENNHKKLLRDKESFAI